MGTTTLLVAPIAGSRFTSEVAVGGRLRLLETGEPPPPGHVLWRVLTSADGDKLIVWNPDVFAEIREAKEMFDQCILAGLVPYVCDERGRPTGKVMTEFDPGSGQVNFQEVVFAPAPRATGG